MLLREQMLVIMRNGIDLTLVSSPGSELDEIARTLLVRCYPIPMARTPNPVRDLVSLARLTRFLIHGRFDIVHSSTPKAGLLTALAARIANVPVRIHTYTGQPWVELQGPIRRIARCSDRIVGLLDTHTYADSASQRMFLINEGLVEPAKISVLGAGSISGVDLSRFSLEKWGGNTADQTRCELGIPREATVIIFVGRLTKDKGICELVRAFEWLGARSNHVHLVLVGPLEPERDPLPAETMSRLRNGHRIHNVGFSLAPEKYLAAADIFCLPSYREGFGSVVIEAAAMELPAVVTRITGLVDSVVEGVTGLIVQPKNACDLGHALQTLIDSDQLRRSLGRAGRKRVVQNFDAVLVNGSVVAEYFRLLYIARPGRCC